MPLTRDLNPMPDDVRAEIEARGLMAAYRARPAYQQNDYLGWIARAKRLAQMLDELERGDAYMNMPYRGPRS